MAVGPRSESRMTDEFEPKRAAMRDEFFGKLYLPGGFIGGTDTWRGSGSIRKMMGSQ